MNGVRQCDRPCSCHMNALVRQDRHVVLEVAAQRAAHRPSPLSHTVQIFTPPKRSASLGLGLGLPVGPLAVGSPEAFLEAVANLELAPVGTRVERRARTDRLATTRGQLGLGWPEMRRVAVTG